MHIMASFNALCKEQSEAFEVPFRVCFHVCVLHCRELFKKLKMLSFKSQYVFSLLLFVANNEEQCYFLIFTMPGIAPTFTNHYLTEHIKRGPTILA